MTPESLLSGILVQLVLLDDDSLSDIIMECQKIKHDRRIAKFRILKDKEPITQ